VRCRQVGANAERTGVGRVWVGSILLAGAASLPEADRGVVVEAPARGEQLGRLNRSYV
jgi:hypothetical protein